MKTTATLLLTIVFSLNHLLAQHKSDEEIIGMYQQLLIEYHDAINTKNFEKKWKTRKKGWIEKCYDTKDAHELVSPLLYLTNNLLPKTFVDKWDNYKEKWVNKSNTVVTPPDFGRLIIDLEAYINRNSFNKKWDKERSNWIDKIKQADKEYTLAEQAKNPELDLDKEAFQQTFNQLFDIAQSGLKELAKGDERTKENIGYWQTDFLIEGAFQAIIVNNEEHGVLKYYATYQGGTSKTHAYEILQKLLKRIDEIIPQTFEKKEQFSYNLIDNKEFQYEFQSDKLAEILHRPSILIGILKQGDKYKILFEMTEAYYKNKKP